MKFTTERDPLKVVARCNKCNAGYVSHGKSNTPKCVWRGCDGDIKPTQENKQKNL